MFNVLMLFFLRAHHVFTAHKQGVFGVHSRVVLVFRVRLLREWSFAEQCHILIGSVDKRRSDLIPLLLLFGVPFQVPFLL